MDALGWRTPDARNSRPITAHHSKQPFRHRSALKGSNKGGNTFGGVKRKRSSPLCEVNSLRSFSLHLLFSAYHKHTAFPCPDFTPDSIRARGLSWALGQVLFAPGQWLGSTRDQVPVVPPYNHAGKLLPQIPVIPHSPPSKISPSHPSSSCWVFCFSLWFLQSRPWGKDLAAQLAQHIDQSGIGNLDLQSAVSLI